MLAVDVGLYGGTLVIEADSADNHIWLSRSNGLIFVNIVGQAYVPHYSEANVWDIEMYGGAGNDYLLLSNDINKTAMVWGGPGSDYIVGGAGRNDLVGHGFGSGIYDEDNDDNAADTIVGGRGETYYWGQGGNDQIYTDTFATSGTDFMFGGSGNDKFYVRGHGGNARVEGEGGHDELFITQAATQQVFYNGGSGTDYVNYFGWTEPVYAKADGVTKSGLRYGERRHELGTDVEGVQATDHDDFLVGTSAANIFLAHGGDDQIYGYGGDDIIFAGDGDDLVDAGSGNDYVDGGNGEDTIYGGSGHDSIYGGAGNDDLAGGSGNDRIWGGSGNDLIHGNGGNDQLYGEAGSDWIYGDAGNDLHVGGSGSDFIYASDGVFGNDFAYGDNLDGTGAGGALDVIYADRFVSNGQILLWDQVFGFESTVYWPF